MVDKPPLSERARPVLQQLQQEPGKLAEASKNVFARDPKQRGAHERANDAALAFAKGSATNKITVLGGVLSGVTLGMQGLRNMRKGWKKDEEGKRDYATVALGAAEAAGGVFVTKLFYERMHVGMAADADQPDAPSR